MRQLGLSWDWDWGVCADVEPTIKERACFVGGAVGGA